MFKKNFLLFFSLFFLGIFLFTSCVPILPVTEGIFNGQVIVPEGTLQAKDLTGQALPNATINIIDPVTGAIIATTVTDANGYYQVFVPEGGPYLLQAIKDGVKLLQITSHVEVGIEYDLGTADCSTTTVALIAQAMLDAEDYPDNLANINLTDIEADPDFNDVMSVVCSKIEAGSDPTELVVVQQAVEDFLYPIASTPTYTVTYNGNGNTAGTVPEDPSHYGYGITVTVLGNTGTLEKTVYSFIGWNTQADGSGTDQAEGSAFTMGNDNVTLYAKWTITVTFDKDDDGAAGTMADQIILSGSIENLTACTFTKTGWTFSGWAETSGGAIVYADGAYIMGTANVILYAKWTPPETYSLCDIGPAGGWIFYDKGISSDGWRYLEAAPSDQSGGASWGCYGIGSYGMGIPGADGTAVGTGEQNTIDIEAGCTTPGTAADICANLNLGGYDDWFLPSKDELNLMCYGLKFSGVGGFFANFYYWSSSQFYGYKAWAQLFDNGYQYDDDKTMYNLVRAVRAF